MDDSNSQKELEEKGYTLPEFIFVIESQKYEFKEQSQILNVVDWVELNLKDAEGKPIGNADFTVRVKDGTESKGKTNAVGYAKVENVMSSEYVIILDGYEMSNI